MTTRQTTKKINKDILLEQKLKKEDFFEFPMDDRFFNQMHDQIMQAVEKTEIKEQTQWAKTYVLLKSKTRPFQLASQKVFKVAFLLLATSLSVGLGGLSLGLFQKTHEQQVSKNQQRILNLVAATPADWSELAAVSQSDGDLYAEILNQKIEQHGLDALEAIKDL